MKFPDIACVYMNYMPNADMCGVWLLTVYAELGCD